MRRAELGFVFLMWTYSSIAQVPSSFSSNLPLIVIDTHGQDVQDDPKITANMGIIYNGPGAINHITDSSNNFKGIIGIEFRGSSSQQFLKKSYSIEIDDASGNSIDASLLGLPAKDDWVLLAPYDDKTMIRDALAYKLGRDQNRYASRSRYCEIIMNGYYMGVFVLLEKIKRDKYRVPIAKLDPTSTTGDAVTGGYILKIDKTTGTGGEGWTSAYRPLDSQSGQTIYFQYDYPKDEDIVAEQQTYIQGFMAAFEGTLAGDHFTDPVQGYNKYIDQASFIDYFLIQEITKNPDGYRLSTYFYKQRDSDGGKLVMGPIWDFNEGFGNVNYCTQGTTDGFVVTSFNSICPTDGFQIPFWWQRLSEDPSFRAALGLRWSALRQGPFQETTILNYVDSVASVLNQGAQQRNFQAWQNVMGFYVWPNYYVGTSFNDEVDWMKTWISGRLKWLDSHISVVTGIEESASAFSVSLYPNPFAGDLSLDCQVNQPGVVQIEVLDVLGRSVGHVQLPVLTAGRLQAAVPFEQAPSGIYIVRARLGDGDWIVQRAVKH
jgi:hypothetical protein